ncbi:hypothetical protein Tco_1489988, partial [Tanacetum coccineum]
EKLSEESVKRQKLEDDVEKAELKLCLEIAPNYDKAINIEPLATKSPITRFDRSVQGRIVGIKSLLSAVEVTAADMEDTTAGYGFYYW